ncbi:uncharacterized protein VTP21DRAFT_714 [Calcarisporiella thermophila]|uniref:uncharacterized protein n=1 Tax=Calcarisporiella thermophila TaxID=911321 RepID=UPI0037422EBF
MLIKLRAHALQVSTHCYWAHLLSLVSSRRAYSIPLNNKSTAPAEHSSSLEPTENSLRKRRRIKQITIQNGLTLLRTKPQPTWVSMMIKNRIRANQKRVDNMRLLEEFLYYAVSEDRMMKELKINDIGYSQALRDTIREIKKKHWSMLQGLHNPTANNAGNQQENI